MQSRPLKIDLDFVRQLEELSGLQLPDRERESMREHLDRILTFVRKLQELDTDGIEPCSHPLSLEAPRRPDEPRASLDPAEALSQSPASEGQFFVVPPVLAARETPNGDDPC